jgi:hypothetical protein
MEWADMAKALIAENPALAAPGNKEMLLEQIYDRESSDLSDHFVSLDEWEVAR